MLLFAFIAHWPGCCTPIIALHPPQQRSELGTHTTISIYREESWVWKSLSNLLKVTEQVHGGDLSWGSQAL